MCDGTLIDSGTITDGAFDYSKSPDGYAIVSHLLTLFPFRNPLDESRGPKERKLCQVHRLRFGRSRPRPPREKQMKRDRAYI